MSFTVVVNAAIIEASLLQSVKLIEAVGEEAQHIVLALHLYANHTVGKRRPYIAVVVLTYSTGHLLVLIETMYAAGLRVVDIQSGHIGIPYQSATVNKHIID